LLNHTVAQQTVSGVPTGVDLLSDDPVSGSVKLGPFDVRIVRLDD
jgi:hypothetical protein